MASCKHLMIGVRDSDELLVSCTDKATLDWLVNEVQKYCTTAKVEAVHKLPNGEPYYYKLGNVYAKTPSGEVVKAENMEPWLIKQLLEQGWEPLGKLESNPTFGSIPTNFFKELIMRTD